MPPAGFTDFTIVKAGPDMFTVGVCVMAGVGVDDCVPVQDGVKLFVNAGVPVQVAKNVMVTVGVGLAVLGPCVIVTLGVIVAGVMVYVGVFVGVVDSVHIHDLVIVAVGVYVYVLEDVDVQVCVQGCVSVGETVPGVFVRVDVQAHVSVKVMVILGVTVGEHIMQVRLGVGVMLVRYHVGEGVAV